MINLAFLDITVSIFDKFGYSCIYLWLNPFNTREIVRTKQKDSNFFKRAFYLNFEKLRKNLQKYVYQHDPIAILVIHPHKKVQEKKFYIFPLESKFRPSYFK